MTPAAFAEAFIAAICRRSRFHGLLCQAGLHQRQAVGEGVAGRGRRRAAGGRGLRPVRHGPAASASMSNTSRPTRRGRCMSAIAAARCSAMRWPIFSPRWAIDVTREYYINDAGAQIDVLARSAYLRYREALGEDHRRDSGRALSRRLSEAGGPGAGRAPWRLACRHAGSGMAAARAVGRDGDDARPDPRRSRGARHSSRSVLVGGSASPRQGGRRGDRRPDAAGPRLSGPAAAAEGRSRRRIGKIASRLLFRATAFGDDIDRPLRQVGRVLHLFRLRRRLRARQAGPRLRAADLCARRRPWRLCQAPAGACRGAVGRTVWSCDVRLCQLVKLFRGGEPVRMSKRAGRVRDAARSRR